MLIGQVGQRCDMEIKGKVQYVENDRNKALFEVQAVTFTVSYNSYLIDDEMVALVDG